MRGRNAALFRRLRGWLLTLCAAASLVLTSTTAWARADRAGMFRHETEHYVVETDTTPQFAEVVGRHMEEIFKEYSRRFTDYGKLTERFHVVVSLTQQAYARRVPPQVRGSTGVFVSAERLLAAHCQNRTPEEVLRTLYHEGFHQFMYGAVSQRCPIWLNEGLAEYFSEATWNGQGFTAGQVPTMRLYTVQQALKGGTYIRLGKLFAMEPPEWIQNVSTDARRASLHYSQVWSIVQFLIHADDGAYAGLLNQFVKEISDGRAHDDAFRRCFGTDLAAFEATWARYIMSLRPSPKFQCRDNMEAILLLAGMAYGDARQFTSVAELRQRLLRGRSNRWEIIRPTGQKVASDRRTDVAALFRCPFHQGEHSASYVLVRDPHTGMPILVCNHHAGVIIKAYYESAARGSLRPAVEEEVRETVGPDLQQALAEAVASQLQSEQQ